MTVAALLLATLMTTEPDVAVVAVRLDTSGPRPALRVECTGPGGSGSVEREGDEVIIRVGLPIAGPIVAPAGRGVVEQVRVTREDGVVVVRARVERTVPFEVDRQAQCLAVLFGERLPGEEPDGGGASAAAVPVSADATGATEPNRVALSPNEPAQSPATASTNAAVVPASPISSTAIPTDSGGPAQRAGAEATSAAVVTASPISSTAPTAPVVAPEPAVSVPTAASEPAASPTPAALGRDFAPSALAAATATSEPQPVDPAALFGAAAAPVEGGAPERLTTYDFARLFPGRDETLEPAVQGGLTAPRDPMSVSVKFLTLRPSLVVSLVDSEVFLLDTNRIVHDRFVQIQPGLGAGAPLAVGISALDGRLRFGYEPRFRVLSRFELGTTHVADAVLDLPIGARAKTLAAYRYFNGILETAPADPGREYFFYLGRYRRHEATLGGQYEIGPRLGAVGSFDWTSVSFDEKADFFPYESQTLRAGLNYDLRADKRLSLTYQRQHIPPSPERPVVETTSDELMLELKGAIGLSNGELGVGMRGQDSPRAGPGGQSFRGLVGRGRISRDVLLDSRLELYAERMPWISAYELNAHYIANTVQLRLTTPLPGGFYGSALGAWQNNSYNTVSSSLGEPRDDRLLGWAVGLGRTLTRWAFFRADYRKDYRDSNVPGYSVDTRSFVIQFGLGAFGEVGAESRVRGSVGSGTWR